MVINFQNLMLEARADGWHDAEWDEHDFGRFFNGNELAEKSKKQAQLGIDRAWLEPNQVEVYKPCYILGYQDYISSLDETVGVHRNTVKVILDSLQNNALSTDDEKRVALAQLTFLFLERQKQFFENFSSKRKTRTVSLNTIKKACTFVEEKLDCQITYLDHGYVLLPKDCPWNKRYELAWQ
jgi:hypothetical protein